MTAKHPPHKLLYPEKSDPLFFEQNPEHLAPARPLADVPDSDRPPRSDGAAEQYGASPASDAHASPPEVASHSVWSEPMPHEGNEQTIHRDEPTGMLALIERMAGNATTPVEQLREMLAFQKELMAHQAQIDFLEAKTRIKKKLSHIRIVKNKAVLYDIVKNHPEQGQAEAFKFAPLEEIDKHLAPLLAEEDMDLSYTTRPRTGDGGGAVIVGKLRHVKGHWEESEIPLPLDTSGGKNNLQAMGSTNSYGRRYIACNLFNVVVVGDDDDGIGGTIDEAQTKAIRTLLEQTGSNEAAFLKYLKAPSIEAIPYRAYPKAMSALEEKMAKNADRS